MIFFDKSLCYLIARDLKFLEAGVSFRVKIYLYLGNANYSASTRFKIAMNRIVSILVRFEPTWILRSAS